MAGFHTLIQLVLGRHYDLWPSIFSGRGFKLKSEVCKAIIKTSEIQLLWILSVPQSLRNASAADCVTWDFGTDRWPLWHFGQFEMAVIEIVIGVPLALPSLITRNKWLYSKATSRVESKESQFLSLMHGLGKQEIYCCRYHSLVRLEHGLVLSGGWRWNTGRNKTKNKNKSVIRVSRKGGCEESNLMTMSIECFVRNCKVMVR